MLHPSLENPLDSLTLDDPLLAAIDRLFLLFVHLQLNACLSSQASPPLPPPAIPTWDAHHLLRVQYCVLPVDTAGRYPNAVRVRVFVFDAEVLEKTVEVLELRSFLMYR